MMTVYGIYNAYDIKDHYYNIDIDKEIGESINLVFISDVHVGTSIDYKALSSLVDKVNDSNVDLLIIGGDLFDEHTKEIEKEFTYDLLSEIKTKYGVFFVEGNHDLLTEKMKYNFNLNNVTWLSDDNIFIDNKFYLVGRRSFSNTSRSNLSSLLKKLDQRYPIILVDHELHDIELASDLGVDLALFGHTHAGQIYPLGYFVDSGYKKKNDFQSIVSSGFGTWGFPVRTEGNSEVLFIKIY